MMPIKRLAFFCITVAGLVWGVAAPAEATTSVTYDTFLDFKSDIHTLAVGTHVQTLGYYQAADGGGAEFLMTSDIVPPAFECTQSPNITPSRSLNRPMIFAMAMKASVVLAGSASAAPKTRMFISLTAAFE